MFVTGSLNRPFGLVPDIGHYDFVCLPLDTHHCDCGVTGPNLRMYLEKRLKKFQRFQRGIGTPNWDRTSDNLIKSQVLYQLSYGRIAAKFMSVAT